MGPQRARRARGRRSRRHRREMCPEEGGAAGLGELRSWWEVPAIAHFCSLFRTAFRLPDFEIEVSGRARRPFTLPRGAPGIPRGRERRQRRGQASAPSRGLGGGARRTARTGRRQESGLGTVPAAAARTAPAPARRGGRAGGLAFVGVGPPLSSGFRSSLGGRGKRRASCCGGLGCRARPAPTSGAPWANSGRRGRARLGAAALRRESLGLRYSLIAPFPSAPTALFMRGPRELLESISPLSQRAIVEEEDGSGQAEGAFTPRLCESRTQTRGPSSRAGGGSVRNGRYRVAAGPPASSFLLVLFLEGGVKYLIGWQVELLALL